MGSFPKPAPILEEVRSRSFSGESVGASSPPARLSNSVASMGEGLSCPTLTGGVEGSGSMTTFLLGAFFFLVFLVGKEVRSIRVPSAIFQSLFVGRVPTMAFHN